MVQSASLPTQYMVNTGQNCSKKETKKKQKNLAKCLVSIRGCGVWSGACLWLVCVLCGSCWTKVLVNLALSVLMYYFLLQATQYDYCQW